MNDSSGRVATLWMI